MLLTMISGGGGGGFLLLPLSESALPFVTTHCSDLPTSSFYTEIRTRLNLPQAGCMGEGEGGANVFFPFLWFSRSYFILCTIFVKNPIANTLSLKSGGP